MTDQPMPEDPHTPEPEPKKGKSCFLGGLATVGAIVLGVVLGGVASFVGVPGGLLAPFLVVALLIGAGLYWRRTPGFLLGLALTIAIALVIGTGCFALLISTSAFG